MTGLEAALEPFPYQSQLIEYLKREERDLWGWFASSKYQSAYAESVRLDLLKSTYRFEPAEHARLYELANEAREALEITAPATIYQSTTPQEMNLSLAFVAGEVHVVLHGAVTSLLDEHELKAALAHELTHYVLWDGFERDLLIARQLLEGIAGHPQANPSHIESHRLFALYLEIHADRGALYVTRDPMPAIRSIIKLQTGLAEVHAESYLRQADEIFSKEKVKTRQLTHPESFIRSRALRDWSEKGRESFAEVERMIEGTAELEALDLVGQVRLSGLTRQLISGTLAPSWFRSEATLAHARKYFPDFAPAEVLDQETCDSIRSLDSSVQRYFAYVLLDFAVADPDLEDVPYAAAISVADRCGIRPLVTELLTKELAMPKKRLARIEQQREELLAEAQRQAASEARP